MTDHYFNALEYAHQLEEAGVPSAQAEVQANTLARVLENCLSSAADSASMKSEFLYKISEGDATVRIEISGVEARLRAEIKEASAKLETRMNWISGVIVTMQLGLFAMVAGLYVR